MTLATDQDKAVSKDIFTEKISNYLYYINNISYFSSQINSYIMKKKIFDCEKVKELYAQGKSIAVIAIEVDAPKNSINKYLKEQGLIREKGHVAKKKEEEKLKRENKFLEFKRKN